MGIMRGDLWTAGAMSIDHNVSSTEERGEEREGIRQKWRGGKAATSGVKRKNVGDWTPPPNGRRQNYMSV